MKVTWIVVANRVQARLFKQTPFIKIKTLNNPLGREKNRALMTSKPGWGRSRYSKSTAVHSMTGEKNPHEEASIQFARRLCEHLDDKRLNHEFNDLIIMAEPKMLGRIRAHMPKHLLANVQWRHQDLGHLSDYEIGKRLGLGEWKKREAKS